VYCAGHRLQALQNGKLTDSLFGRTDRWLRNE